MRHGKSMFWKRRMRHVRIVFKNTREPSQPAENSILCKWALIGKIASFILATAKTTLNALLNQYTDKAKGADFRLLPSNLATDSRLRS
jgi:hypothetical protein